MPAHATAPSSHPKVLIVTNDFPPRSGGIETFVGALADRFDPDQVVVYTSTEEGDAEYDPTLPYPVIRDKTRMLLPTARVRRTAVGLLKEYGCDRVLFGASAPLGLMGDDLRAAGAKRVVAITHGHEVWWARIPGTRSAIRKIAERVDVLTYIAGWTRDQIARAIPDGVVTSTMRRMPPGVNADHFHPDCGGAEVRKQHGIPADAPVVVSVSRIVKRKGQDRLIEGWPQVLRTHPTARLVIAGSGPYTKTLEKLAVKHGVQDSVILAGRVPDMSSYMDAADVFAMPCRYRHFGMEAEGLGIVFLEAAACEKPVIVGDSGGAPDAVIDGETGYLVDPNDVGQIAERITELLSDPAKARAMGKRGRQFVLDGWQWDQIAETCKSYLGM